MHAIRNVLSAAFVILVTSTWISCGGEDEIEMVDCNQTIINISIAEENDASGCIEADGSFVVVIDGGSKPYQFFVNNSFNANENFGSLPAGIHLVSVSDNNGCTASQPIEIQAAGSTLSATSLVTPNTGCGISNGGISIVASGGAMPYKYSIDNNAFSDQADFQNLTDGMYSIKVKDNEGCLFSVNTIVPKGPSNINFDATIKPILNANCNISGCHNGDLGASRNFNVFQTVVTNAQNIKLRTQNRTMPPTGSLSQEEIDLIACWVDGGS